MTAQFFSPHEAENMELINHPMVTRPDPNHSQIYLI
jgi:hypothetical protein